MENPELIPVPTKKHPLKRIFKVLAWLIFIPVLLLGISIALVFYYEKDVKAVIIKELNRNLKSEVRIDPSNIDLTVIRSFPECALDFKNVLIMEALEKKEKDTLLFAGKFSLLFNLKDLWNKNYNIKTIKISDGECNLQITKSGEPNYIFWKESESGKQSEELKFELERIFLKNVALKYKNAKQKIKTDLVIEETVFSGKFGDEQYSMRSEGKVRLNSVQIKKNHLVRNKKLKYDIDLFIDHQNYSISKAELALNEMYFALSGDLKIKDSLQKADIDFKGKNLDIASVLSLLPESYSNRIKDYSSEGDFFAKGELAYHAGAPLKMNAEFGIKNASVTYKPNDKQLEKLNLTGNLILGDKKGAITMKGISAVIGQSNFSGDCSITNFDAPYLDLKANINTSLEELNSFWPLDTMEHISGRIKLDAAVEGPIAEFKNSGFSADIKTHGEAELKDIKAKFKGKANEINISEGNFSLDGRDLSVSNFNLITGHSDIKLNGSLPGFLNYLFDSKEPLIITANLNSKAIVLEDILFAGQSGAKDQRVNVAANLIFNLKCNIEKLSFEKFEAEHLLGEIDIKDQKVAVKGLELNTMDGKARLNAFANASGESIVITAGADLTGINISKLFYQCNNFGQSTLNDKHLKGFATSAIAFSGEWSKTLDANLRSIEASSNLTIERGQLVNFKPLESLSKYIEVQELRDIKFSTLQSNIEIKNEVITIPKTTIKNSAMNIDIWGTHTFKNEIDYHIKLLLSELIASKKRNNKDLDDELSLVENDPENRRSVFIKMTGTVDDPIIKYDRKGLKQKIGEDIKAEKQNLKQILNEEFGLFKKDSTLVKPVPNKADQKFNIEFGDKKEKKSPNNLQPKKKEDEDDDF